MENPAELISQSCSIELSNVEYSALTGIELEEILHFQHAILESVARGGEAVALVNQVCKLAEQLLPNSVGSVMLLDEDGEFLNVYAAPSIPPEGIARLNALRPGPGGGSCGNAVFRKEAQFVENTYTDSRWQNLRQLAYDFNLCACWSMPIFSSHGNVIGSFALSSFEHRLPTNFHRKLLEIGASIVAIVLERSKTEESLRLFETAYEGSEEGFMITDVNGVVLSVNPAFSKVFGYSVAEVIGKTPKMLASGQHDADYYAGMWDGLINKGVWVGEIWNRRKNGEIFPEWLSISAVKDSAGKISHYVGIFSDISERKQAEQAMLLKERADAANQAKSTFLAHMSHEIRTPMNSIIGMSYLALQSESDPKLRGYLSNIQLSAQNLLGIINDILDFSKIEAGKLELESINLSLSQLFDDLASQLNNIAVSKGLSLTFEIDPELSRPLLGDQLRLNQVLTNFITNAIKFTPHGKVSVRGRAVATSEAGTQVRFEVRDSGIGLSSEQLAQLFQPFHQMDASTTRRYGGTGLGLAISKRLIDLMGGEIGVESQLGKGSTFWFSVQMGKGENSVETVPVNNADLSRLNAARILLVEDNLPNQMLAQELLEMKGAWVTIAGNGQEAIDAMLGQSFDCVLMDMQMPVMDGLEATRQIRANPALAGTCVIAMTANARDEDWLQCRDAGMNDFITKPIEPSKMYITIAKWLDKAIR